MRMIRSAFDDRGATAIEYALIGSLIGLGLIGSLVATKGSLSAVFGVASSQIGSSVAAAPSGNPQSALWAGKTLAALPTRSVSGAQAETIWLFTDGTRVDIQTGIGGVFDSRLYITDPANKMRTYYYADTNGNQTIFQQEFMSPDMSYVTKAISSNTIQSPLSGEAPTVATMTTDTYSRPGVVGSSVKSAPSSDFIQADKIGYYNWSYFLSAAPGVK